MITSANASPPGNCKFAIPKKGRFFDKITDLLKGSGVEYRREPRLDVALCTDLPITLVFLPATDIAKYVGEGNVDIGITGSDVVEESNVNVKKVMNLGFGKCKLCVQAPVADCVRDVAALAGKRVVTSFPYATEKYFKSYDEAKGVKTKIIEVSGSVEVACGLGLADAVVDLVETGTTMRAAGLEVVAEILETEATLISNPHSKHDDIVNILIRRIEGYIVATKYVMVSYNVHNDNLKQVIAITPGKKSPNITTLDDINFKAVSSLVKKSEVSKIMDKLHDVGATDILTFQLSNTRM